MSIGKACQAQPEGGCGSVCLPVYLSKDRKWLTDSGGVNSLLVINLALPVEAACHEHFGLSLTLINKFKLNAIWWFDSDKLPRMLCLIMPQNCCVYSHFGGLLLCKRGENIGLMFHQADGKGNSGQATRQTKSIVFSVRELYCLCFTNGAESCCGLVDPHLKVCLCCTSNESGWVGDLQ
ncbi:hypothetical protein XENOCAPTIV_016999 [Xenoophorus captivus]|uniref:Uncharacterized protein n=1 Tax=Xenoophorus captivus TaxID=1517983 RepID=A0ABV0R1S9_9TELE